MNPIIEEIITICKHFDVPEARKYLEKFEIRLRNDKEANQHEQSKVTGTCTSIPAKPYDVGDTEANNEPDRYERMNIQERFLDDD